VYTLKASGDQTGGSFGLVEVSTPEGSGPPPHVHEREDELFYVLEGTYEVTVGGELRGGGRLGHLRSTKDPARVRCEAGPARHLGFVFPNGWETFFHDVVRTMGESSPNPETLARMAMVRGVTVLGPPPGSTMRSY
jgi:hypothetical protein